MIQYIYIFDTIYIYIIQYIYIYICIYGITCIYIYIHDIIYTYIYICIHSQAVQTINIHRQYVQLWRFNEKLRPICSENAYCSIVSDVSLFTGMSWVISNLP